jgi:hypothetical protein
MTTSQPVQNLSICVALMTLSGFLRVVATMVLAYPDFVAKRNGDQSGRGVWYIAIHVLLLSIAAVISVVGTFYGPVSIAIPVQTGSQLLFNVIAMGLILKMRAFNKAQRTGTYVVFFSVLSLIDVGPGTQDGQNVMKLLSHPVAAAWAIFVAIGLVVAAIGTIQLLRKENHNERIEDRRNVESEENDDRSFRKDSFLVLLAGVTLSNVAMATSGKALGYLRGIYLVIAFIYYFVSSLLGLLFSVTSATTCDQGFFTPASSVALVVVNFITGIIIWEDWQVMDTWVGYICACLLMCCGVYLLAEIDILEQYLVKRTATIVRHGVAESSQDTTDPLRETLLDARGLVSAVGGTTQENCDSEHEV